MNDNKTIITIKHCGRTVSYSFDYPDTTTGEMYDAFKGIMIAIGFGEENINDYLKEAAND